MADIELTTAAMPIAEPDESPTQSGQMASDFTSAPAGNAPPPAVVVGEMPTDAPNAPVEELQNTALPQRAVEQYLWEIKHQPNWRREADRCADYYDGNQLDQDLIEKLKDRGQPPLITNLIKPTVDTVLGMEAKTRTDWIVRPEDDTDSNDDVAEALSLKLKHAETESRADRACSDAYAGQIKAGLGWVEVARESDPLKFPYRVNAIHRREIFWDWRAERYDLSDARYLIRRRWLELDHAIAMMPQYADLFRATTCGWAGFDPLIEQNTNLHQSFILERDTRIEAVDWRDIQRERLCLYEIWYRKWVRGYVVTLANGKTVECDFNNTDHCQAILAGAPVKMATFQKVRLAWYCGPHFLYDIPSPYTHNYFPYVPFFGYREDLTQVPYGLVRSMISPQDEINARKSKALWLLNSRRVIADSDAVTDHDEAQEQVARPDAYIILDSKRKPGSKFEVSTDANLSAQQFSAMQESKQEIEEASGVHKVMQGQQSGASSGLAINSLVEQGLNTLAEINDNYRHARRLVGEQLFYLLQADMKGRPVRVKVGDGMAQRVITLNGPVQDPKTGQVTVQNDISAISPKVVLDDIPSTPTFRLQQLQMLTEITKSLPPQLQGQVIDFVIAATDLPNRQEIVDRLRGSLGILTPDQQQQKQQAQEQAQQAQAAVAKQMEVLTAAEKAANIRAINAKASLDETNAHIAHSQVVLEPPGVALGAPPGPATNDPIANFPRLPNASPNIPAPVAPQPGAQP
jgi:hypothetical protein